MKLFTIKPSPAASGIPHLDEPASRVDWRSGDGFGSNLRRLASKPINWIILLGAFALGLLVTKDS